MKVNPGYEAVSNATPPAVVGVMRKKWSATTVRARNHFKDENVRDSTLLRSHTSLVSVAWTDAGYVRESVTIVFLQPRSRAAMRGWVD